MLTKANGQPYSPAFIKGMATSARNVIKYTKGAKLGMTLAQARAEYADAFARAMTWPVATHIIDLQGRAAWGQDGNQHAMATHSRASARAMQSRINS